MDGTDLDGGGEDGDRGRGDPRASGWLAFVNRESRDRVHRLRVMTHPGEVRTFLIHRLRAAFDFPLRCRLACAVADRDDSDGVVLHLVPLDIDPDGYELLGPIQATADEALLPGSVALFDLELDAPGEASGVTGRVVGVEPVLGVTT